MRKISYIIALILLYSCVDPIKFESNSPGEDFVFYGNFTQLNEDQEFFISSTSNFGKHGDPVTQASVVIKDDQGGCADYLEMEEGKYILPAGTFQGFPGRYYHIEIDFQNGVSYFTIPQEMPSPIEVSNIYFTIGNKDETSSSGVTVEKTVIDVKIDTPLKNEKEENAYLRWTVDEVYSFTDRSCGPFDYALTCYFIDQVDASASLLFKNVEGTQENLKGYNVRSRLLLPYDEFTGRHYFIVRQNTISEESYNYWEEINIVTNQTGSLFDRQPARVRGNIFKKDNEAAFVIGKFDVSGQDVARIFTTPDDIKPHQALFTCLDFSYFREHRSECCNCSAKMGDQIERPDYW